MVVMGRLSDFADYVTRRYIDSNEAMDINAETEKKKKKIAETKRKIAAKMRRDDPVSRSRRDMLSGGESEKDLDSVGFGKD
jgi:hypothetical protein